MTSSIVLPLVILALLPLAALCGAVESAVNSVSRARVEEMAKDGAPGATALLSLLEHRARHVNLLVFLRALAEVGAIVTTTYYVLDRIEERHDEWAIVLIIAVMTLVVYVILGVSSRTVGRQNPYKLSLSAAPLLRVVSGVLNPLTRLLIRIGNLLTPGKSFQNGPFTSEVELREAVDIAQERGVVEDDEREMIQNIFDLGSTLARQVMVPRPEMVWIESDKTLSQAVALAVKSGFSRIPVIGENVDDVVGVLNLKDVTQALHRNPDHGASLAVTKVMRPVHFVPDSRELDNLLEDMQLQRFHLAMLIDEYGGIAGLLTIEDILEEIVGEIMDEYDSGEIAPVVELEDGSFRVLARLGLDEVEELFDGFEFPVTITDEVDTITGLLAYGMGRVPLDGSEVEVAGLHLVGEGGRNRRGRVRLRTVVVRRLEDPDAPQDTAHDAATPAS